MRRSISSMPEQAYQRVLRSYQHLGFPHSGQNLDVSPVWPHLQFQVEPDASEDVLSAGACCAAFMPVGIAMPIPMKPVIVLDVPSDTVAR